MPRRNRLTAVDLFSGGGALSLGLKRARFNVIAAAEIDKEIAKTYKANHPKTRLLLEDIRKVTGKELLKGTRKSSVDLVAGCPPCQGFSSLTSKYKKKDPRNDLVLEMGRLIKELSPKMVMMENVPGLAHRGKRILNKFTRDLEEMGYEITWDVLQLANYGVPQSRRRLVLLAGKGFKISLPEATHSRKGDRKKSLKKWLTLADAIKGMERPVTLSAARAAGGPRKYNWHVVSDLNEISKARYRATKPGKSRYSLPVDLRPQCHASGDEGFSNVYGRMSWRKVPPTITGGCTTPCKGRFGHPTQLRTISVREAATIQTFPTEYTLETDYLITAVKSSAMPFPRSLLSKLQGNVRTLFAA